MKTKTWIIALLLGSGLINSDAQDTWTKKASFGGVARAGATAFSIGNKGYVGLGDEYPISYKDFWEYDPDSDIWTQKADFGGDGRLYAVGFTIAGKGYVGTGQSGTFPNYTYYKDFWEYDPSTNIWTRKADFGGSARYGAVGFGIDSKGYLGTGVDSSIIYKRDFWEFAPIQNTWTQRTDFGGIERKWGTGFSIGAKGYVGTGLDKSNHSDKDFWEYDPATDTWVQKADVGGSARLVPVGFSIGNRGYVGTGENENTTMLRDLWEYDPDSNTWTQKADFGGTGRNQAAGFSVGDKGYVGTGVDPSYKKDFWEYTPDGASSAGGLIAFIDFSGQLYTINPDGTGKKLIRSGYDPDWSPAGTQLAFANPAVDFEVAVMNADGSEVHNLTSNSVRDTFPAWSPDGSQIAFYSERGPIGVWLMNSDGSNQHFLSDGILANWSPDGSKIIFQTGRDGNSEVYTMNPDGSGLTNLSNNPEEDTVPCYSPDGSLISFRSDRDGNGEIYLMDADGSNQMRLTYTPEDEDETSWSSDGAQIAFQSLRSPVGVYIMNSDGTNQRFVPNSDGGGRPDWQPVVGAGNLTLLSAASRKNHGNAGSFDIDLPLTGTPGVECRVGNGGTFLQIIVFTFSEPVTSVSGTTTTTCGRVNSTTISGSTVMVELGHVSCDGSDITVTVPGINGASGSVDASATMTLRTGDVNADGVVGTADLKEIRMNVGRGLVNDENFRDDITVDGKVNHGDTTLEKSKL